MAHHESVNTDCRPIIYISSRKSSLALFQTNEVKRMLEEGNPQYRFEIGIMDTLGDQVLDRHLADLGKSIESGLFTKSLETELLNGKSRLAVHSLKDMPTRLPKGLMLGAICKRESPEDAVIIHPKHLAQGRSDLKSLPHHAVIGTSSLRREALILRSYPHFIVKTIRGNIQTRLTKLEEHDEYDAIIVAAAGFRRGGLGDRINEILPADSFGYGVGQGSIGVECCENDEEIKAMLQRIQHEESAQLCTAERSLLYHLEGGCQISMGVCTKIVGDQLTLDATLLSRDGKVSVEEQMTGSKYEAEKIGYELATKIIQREGALSLLGPQGEKRALTYGNVECPGDAASQAAKSS